MCLGIPGKVISKREGDLAEVDFGGGEEGGESDALS